VRSLDASRLAKLALAYDKLSVATLRPLAQLDADPSRLRIDEAICSALDLPSLTPIRELLAREPGLTGTDGAGTIAAPVNESEPDDEVGLEED